MQSRLKISELEMENGETLQMLVQFLSLFLHLYHACELALSKYLSQGPVSI